MTDLEIKRFKHREYMRRINGSLPEDKHCSVCGAHMPGRKKSAKFCSNRCRQVNKYDKKRVRPKKQLTQTEGQA